MQHLSGLRVGCHNFEQRPCGPGWAGAVLFPVLQGAQVHASFANWLRLKYAASRMTGISGTGSSTATFIGLPAERAFTVDASTAARALGDTLQLARRFKLSSYDAAYLELALREGPPLATLDADLQGAMAQIDGALV